MKSNGSVDLLGIGIAPVDFLVSMVGYPDRGRKIDGISGSTVIAGGGPVPTALCTFSKMGGSASLITSFGDDTWGQYAREELDRFGIRHDLCLVRKSCSSALASAWIDASTGDRTIVLDMSPRLYITPRDIRTKRLPRAKLIHVDGRHIEADVKLARWGKTIGARIMLDVGSVRNRVDDLFPYLDFLVCADQYALHYCKTRSIEKAAMTFKRIGIPEVVVTSGTAGSIGFDGDGNRATQRAFRVSAVDATGAGDVFHGAYLYGIHRGWDLPKRLKFASAAAALKCRFPGARRGIPSLTQTTRFMNGRRPLYA